jgi:hypothetical protein
MDYGWMSHALLWLVGLMTVGATVGVIGALWSTGRLVPYFGEGCRPRGRRHP